MWKKFSNFRFFIVLLVAFAVSSSAYVIYQEPDRLVVASDGSIDDRFTLAKEWAKGKSFWENQLSFVIIELDRPVKILDLMEKLGESDRITEEVLIRSNEIMMRSENENIQKYLTSKSYQLKEESERLRRLAERLERYELLNSSYQNSLSQQEKFLNLKSFIERQIASYK